MGRVDSPWFRHNCGYGLLAASKPMLDWWPWYVIRYVIRIREEGHTHSISSLVLQFTLISPLKYFNSNFWFKLISTMTKFPCGWTVSPCNGDVESTRIPQHLSTQHNTPSSGECAWGACGHQCNSNRDYERHIRQVHLRVRAQCVICNAFTVHRQCQHHPDAEMIERQF
ncbi:hypothetical protein BJ138DRAFT_323481 [Hygrophoropsis aurantiaca]|uniref:Uncharacterized protein n=1 Tax=Hygrophoropsis aurantiaca TaxID=72124 RepID=A0ACB8A6R0_9AGAM|nr:hypothetical protein BJ138DRAFT_323481 [Hygrophoropsis aurantiaca]